MVLIGTTSPFKGLMALIVSSRSIVVISGLDEVLGWCRVLTEGGSSRAGGEEDGKVIAWLGGQHKSQCKARVPSAINKRRDRDVVIQ
jgi:hypothetical protein